jgi:hypothetical protein
MKFDKWYDLDNSHCDLCDKPYVTVDLRLKQELKGICFACAQKSNWAGMTSAEIEKCKRVFDALEADRHMTYQQLINRRDSES